MKFEETGLPGVRIIEPVVHRDDRGWFLESYRESRFRELGIFHPFVQENVSFSHEGVLRGLHYQVWRPQAKLVRVLSGEIFDVAVDVRRGSPAFGKWTGVRLSAKNLRMLYVPAGYAHGFYVVSGPATVIYKCSAYYAPDEERGILWNDPALRIGWPLDGPPLVAPKDSAFPILEKVAPQDLPEAPR